MNLVCTSIRVLPYKVSFLYWYSTKGSKAGMSKRISYGKKYYPNVRFVWMSVCVCNYPADPILYGVGFLPIRVTMSAQTCIRIDMARLHGGDMRRANNGLRKCREASMQTRGSICADAVLEGAGFRIFEYKKGSSLLFPSLPTNLGWIVGDSNGVFILHFFPTKSLGSWLEVYYRQGGEVFLFCRFFNNCWFRKCWMKGLLQGTQRANQSLFQWVKSDEENWKLKSSPHIIMQGPLDLLTMEINQAKNARRQFSKLNINS